MGIVKCCEHTIAEDQAMADIVAVNPKSDYDTVVIDTLQERAQYAPGIIERPKPSMAQYEAVVIICEQDDLPLVVDAEGVSSAVTPGPRMRGVDGHIGVAMPQEAVINEVAVNVSADDVTALIDTSA